MTKLCSKCKSVKEDKEFHKCSRYGLQYYCKTCSKESLNYETEKWYLFHIESKYGIKREDYFQMLEKQRGLCAICNEPSSNKKRLCLDHSHITGKVRKLLCSRCNRGLGQFRDDINLMNKATDYLKCHQEA